ncbi:MAG: hypothetical protein ABI666_06020 [Ferruginibacter sp.]
MKDIELLNGVLAQFIAAVGVSRQGNIWSPANGKYYTASSFI